MDKASEAKAWNAYYEANRQYAEALAEIYQPGDLVRFLHCSDYSLHLLKWMKRTGLDSRLPFNAST